MSGEKLKLVIVPRVELEVFSTVEEAEEIVDDFLYSLIGKKSPELTIKYAEYSFLGNKTRIKE